MQRATSFVVFLLGGLGLGFFTFQLLMWAVWGAPTHPVQYIALLSSILLIVSAFVCLFTSVAGRVLATCSLLGIGTLYIPASASLVPAATIIVSPIAYLLLFGYFALLAFALFFPRRWRWSIPLFACCLLTSGAFAATTYFHRLQQGEIHWPSFVYFEWTPTADPLHVEHDTDGWITPETTNVLSEHGVTGILRWSGSQGYPAESRRVIIICRSRIPTPKDLPYPKQGTIIYVFDGTAWKTVPDQPNVYAAHATLQTDGMLEQVTPGGGAQGTAAFTWR
jgi:hypothetical protein